MSYSTEEKYEQLRAWRNERARKEGIRPFRIFSNRELQEIAKLHPVTKDELQLVFGVGPNKVAKYARPVLKQLSRMA